MTKAPTVTDNKGNDITKSEDSYLVVTFTSPSVELGNGPFTISHPDGEVRHYDPKRTKGHPSR